MRKKKRSKISGHPQAADAAAKAEKKAIESLAEAFSSSSFEEAAAAYKEAGGDANKAAGILGNLTLAEEASSSSGNWASSSRSSSSGTTSSSSYSEAFGYGSGGGGGNWNASGFRGQKGRQKKVVATAGTVSSMLGKDYVRSVQKRTSLKSKGFGEEPWSEAEQFLGSMLGEETELSMDVVRDVLCGCGYDVEKALNTLLELSSSMAVASQFGAADACSPLELSDSLTDRTSDSASHSSETDNEWYKEHHGRSFFQVLSAGIDAPAAKSAVVESQLSQQVLESLFNMPTPKSAEREPNTMNWRNIVRKMTSLGQGGETYSGGVETMMLSSAKGEDYQVLRQDARQHWDSMKLCYKKAATAFSNGDKAYASYMSDQGRAHNKIARESEEKASRDIFESRNKTIENVITIDLHGQHVKEAMRLLKLHLLFGACVRSVQTFKVITGCGGHGVGKSKLKQSVVNLLERENIKWTEENRGMLIVKLNGQTQFAFVDSDIDDD